MVEIMGSAGAQFGFVAPREPGVEPRATSWARCEMGADPATSVCDAFGKFHDLDNLHCTDGSVFVTSSGYNPTLTLIALALRTAGHMVVAGLVALLGVRKAVLAPFRPEARLPAGRGDGPSTGSGHASANEGGSTAAPTPDGAGWPFVSRIDSCRLGE